MKKFLDEYFENAEEINAFLLSFSITLVLFLALSCGLIIFIH
jgi:hypothetical protein